MYAIKIFFYIFPIELLGNQAYNCVSQSCDFDAYSIVDQIYIILKVAIILDLHIRVLKFELVGCVFAYPDYMQKFSMTLVLMI